MLNRLFLLVLVHLSPSLWDEYGDEECHGPAHPAEVEEEAWLVLYNDPSVSHFTIGFHNHGEGPY